MSDQGSRYEGTRQAWQDIWSKASVEIELTAADYARSRETMEMYLPYLSKDGVILEAGCGLGAILIKLREKGYRVIGLDYAENALRTARDYDPSLVLHVGDVHALPYPDNSLHGYLSFGVLEHFEHGMGPALREAHRVLAPGGILVLTIPYPNLVHKLVHWKRRMQHQSQLTDDEFYESAYTQHDLIRESKKAGFSIEMVRPTSHSFTFWGLGGPFQGKGYYETTRLAELLGALSRVVMPWSFNFTTMLIGRKVEPIPDTARPGR